MSVSGRIREATGADAAAISEIYSEYIANSVATFETEPVGAGEMARRMGEGQRTHPWLVCERGGEVVGYAYAGRHHERAAYRWAVAVSVYIRSGRQRGGVGRALYTSLFECLRIQGFQRAFAGIAVPHEASVGLHESFGFKLVGIYEAPGYKHGAWRDVGWWQLGLQAKLADPPAETLPPEVARKRPEWERALRGGERFLR